MLCWPYLVTVPFSIVYRIIVFIVPSTLYIVEQYRGGGGCKSRDSRRHVFTGLLSVRDNLNIDIKALTYLS